MAARCPDHLFTKADRQGDDRTIGYVANDATVSTWSVMVLLTTPSCLMLTGQQQDWQGSVWHGLLPRIRAGQSRTDMPGAPCGPGDRGRGVQSIARIAGRPDVFQILPAPGGITRESDPNGDTKTRPANTDSNPGCSQSVPFAGRGPITVAAPNEESSESVHPLHCAANGQSPSLMPRQGTPAMTMPCCGSA